MSVLHKLTFGLSILVLCGAAYATDTKASVVEKISSKGQGHYLSNRAPLQPSPLIKLPIGSITPKDWLRRQLELDAEGECGNLPEVSNFVKEGCAWASPTGEGHSAWEEPMYWLRGYGDLGYVLNNEKIIANTKKWIEAIIASRQPDGYFGPKELRTRVNGHPESWPHMLALNALRSYYEYTGDKRVIDLMTGYFKWVNTLKNEDFKRSGLDDIRGVEQIANIHWLYNRTGDKWLLDLSKRIFDNIADWTNGRPTPHNVDIAQCFRQPAEFWQQSGDAKHLAASRQRYDEIMGEYGQFPGGGFAGDENIRHGSVDPRQGFETCGFVEFMHSFQILTRIEADPIWADRCEEIAFNSYPAALTADHKGLHYVTCANMVKQDFKNRSVTFTNYWVKTGYSAADYRCCQHNHGIGWSYYAEELWLATADKGLCASLYSASEVKAKVGDGTQVKISEDTNYPFSDLISFKISTPKSVKFPLYLRVPKWCESPKISVNGKSIAVDAMPLTYIKLDRLWKNGDSVTLKLPMTIGTKTWEKNKNSVSVNYGPIWFSLKIGEDWKKKDRLPNWPDYEVDPSTPWNYGLLPDQNFELIKKDVTSIEPFTHETAPFEIKAKARRIPEWTIGTEKWITALQMSPAKTTLPVETVTLIPMGAARLRISSFPTVSTEDSAHAWTAPKLPLTDAFKVSASHVCDSLDAVNDGLEPNRSDDFGIPRFTWWNHKGTTEWLQYDFDKSRKVSSVSVYWFSENEDGNCTVPASWELQYFKDGEWTPVKLIEGAWTALEGKSEYGVKKDQYNTVRFASIETERLRINVNLQENKSGGVLEWQVAE